MQHMYMYVQVNECVWCMIGNKSLLFVKPTCPLASSCLFSVHAPFLTNLKSVMPTWTYMYMYMYLNLVDMLRQKKGSSQLVAILNHSSTRCRHVVIKEINDELRLL